MKNSGSIYGKVQRFVLLLLAVSLSCSIAGIHFALVVTYIVTIVLVVKKEIPVFFPKEAFVLLGFLLLTLLAATYAQNHTASLSHLSKDVRLPMIFCIAWFASTYDPEKWRFYFYLFLGFASFIAIYGIIQHFTGTSVLKNGILSWYYPTWNVQLVNDKLQVSWQVRGTYSHHLTFGGVFLWIWLFCFSLILFDNKDRSFLIMLAIPLTIVLVYSYARSAWIGTLVGIVCIILFRLKQKRGLFIGTVLGGSLLLVILTKLEVTKALFYKLGTIGDRIVSITSASANNDRLYMWKAALTLIKRHPFGVGAKNTNELQTIYDQITASTGHYFLNKATMGVHNLYLQIWLMFGFVALLAFLLWIGMWLWRVYKGILQSEGYEKAILVGIFAGAIGFLIEGIFEVNFYDGEVQTMLLIGMALSWAILHRQKQRALNLEEKTKPIAS